MAAHRSSARAPRWGRSGPGLTIANTVSSTADTTVIRTACTAYEKGRAVANAVGVGTGVIPADAAGKVSVIEEYGDAACANPPAGDALSTAIWFGTLVRTDRHAYQPGDQPRDQRPARYLRPHPRRSCLIRRRTLAIVR